MSNDWFSSIVSGTLFISVFTPNSAMIIPINIPMIVFLYTVFSFIKESISINTMPMNKIITCGFIL